MDQEEQAGRPDAQLSGDTDGLHRASCSEQAARLGRARRAAARAGDRRACWRRTALKQYGLLSGAARGGEAGTPCRARARPARSRPSSMRPRRRRRATRIERARGVRGHGQQQATSATKRIDAQADARRRHGDSASAARRADRRDEQRLSASDHRPRGLAVPRDRRRRRGRAVDLAPWWIAGRARVARRRLHPAVLPRSAARRCPHEPNAVLSPADGSVVVGRARRAIPTSTAMRSRSACS